ncbi:MAG: endonuclease/exonuclease/phosphatase family protein [Bacteroidetes bacterium]|nr:endonuclease/exonuclease/phosphatase family protein [Bacteroidota bacterium]
MAAIEKYKSITGLRVMKPLYTVMALLNFVAVIALVFALTAGELYTSEHDIMPVFGLFYPIFLIANIIFMIFWLLARKPLFLLSALTIIIGYGNLSDNYQISLYQERSEIDTAAIRVLTYNVQQFRDGKLREYPGTKSDILSFISKQNAEIICLQEYQSTGKHIYDSLKKTRDDLNTGTYYYESYYNPQYNQLSGLVIFSRFKAVNSGKLKTEGSRTFGIFTDLLINSDTVRVFNIHLASIKLAKEDIGFVASPAAESQEMIKTKSLAIYEKLYRAFLLREKQTTYLIELIEKTPYKIILSGDFNDTPSSWVYHQLQKKLNDSFVQKGNGIGVTFAGSIPLLRIDYIMHSGFTTLSFKRHNFKRSDHYPVASVLKLNHTN